MELAYRLDLDPDEICTAQQKGECIIAGHIHHYVKPEVERSNKKIERALASCATAKGERLGAHLTKSGSAKRHLMSGFRKGTPLSVLIVYGFKYPKGTPKRSLIDLAPMTKRPDVDNLCKSVLDCLTDFRAWQDDSDVVSLRCLKVRTFQNPFVSILIRQFYADCDVPKIMP